MGIRIRTVGIALGLVASATAFGQSSSTDRAFTATGTTCADVTWTRGALAQYPDIDSACQAVLQRGGQYFVKFEGKVVRVANRGTELTIAFKEGDSLTIRPPENMSLEMNGVPTTVSRLRPGDRLTFYVPDSRLVAHFGPEASIETVAQVPFTPPVAAPREEARTPMMAAAELPRTATNQPLLGLMGLLLAAVGAALTLWRLGRAK